MSITVIIVVVTCIVSFVAFSNQKITDNLIFYPPAISNRNEWYRFFSCGLIHADFAHLAFNMFAFYMFGRYLEYSFDDIFGNKGPLLFMLLYATSLAACLIPTYSRHKDDYHYRSLGASGAVSAIVFVSIFLDPTQKVGMIFIPILIPGFIFGIIYLIVTAYLDRRGGSGINHSAHFWGALYGIAFIIVTSYALSDFRPVANFIEKVTSYF